MITGECNYCHSVRVWKLYPIRHEDGCPTGGRHPQRLSPDESLFFRHPDLAELDLAVSAWYPELAPAP
jgi:hypothetical protein